MDAQKTRKPEVARKAPMKVQSELWDNVRVLDSKLGEIDELAIDESFTAGGQPGKLVGFGPVRATDYWRRYDDIAGFNSGIDQVIHDHSIGIHRHVWSVLLGPRAKGNDHDRRLPVMALGIRPAQIAKMNPGCLSQGHDREQQSANAQKYATDRHHTLRFDPGHIVRADFRLLQADERSN